MTGYELKDQLPFSIRAETSLLAIVFMCPPDSLVPIYKSTGDPIPIAIKRPEAEADNSPARGVEMA